MNCEKRSGFPSLVQAALALLIAVWVSACSVSNELVAIEKALLIVPADLATYGVKPEKLPNGKYQKTTSYFDRSVEYRFELESSEPALYISSTLTVDSSGANSLLSEGAQKTGLVLGLKAAGVVSEEMKTPTSYGDRSTLSLLKLKDKPIGNLFVAVVGNKTYVVLISGFYFDDARLFDELIAPKISRVTSFNPAGLIIWRKCHPEAGCLWPAAVSGHRSGLPIRQWRAASNH